MFACARKRWGRKRVGAEPEFPGMGRSARGICRSADPAEAVRTGTGTCAHTQHARASTGGTYSRRTWRRVSPPPRLLPLTALQHLRVCQQTAPTAVITRETHAGRARGQGCQAEGPGRISFTHSSYRGSPNLFALRLCPRHTRSRGRVLRAPMARLLGRPCPPTPPALTHRHQTAPSVVSGRAVSPHPRRPFSAPRAARPRSEI